MSGFYFVIKTFVFYLRQNITVALGIAVSTGVLTGGLIIGDSVRHSLEKGTLLRLGNTEVAVSGGDRLFTSGLAGRLESETGLPSTPLLRLESSAAADGGRVRISRVQVNGVNESFDIRYPNLSH